MPIDASKALMRRIRRMRLLDHLSKPRVRIFLMSQKITLQFSGFRWFFQDTFPQVPRMSFLFQDQ